MAVKKSNGSISSQESGSSFGFGALTSQDVNEFRQSELIGFRKNANVRFEDFQFLTLLGRGTFGKVFLAKLTNSD